MNFLGGFKWNDLRPLRSANQKCFDFNLGLFRFKHFYKRYNFFRKKSIQTLSHFTTRHPLSLIQIFADAEQMKPFLLIYPTLFHSQKDKTDLNKYLYFLTLLRSIKRAFEQGVCKDTIFATIRITAFFFFNFTL